MSDPTYTREHIALTFQAEDRACSEAIGASETATTTEED